MWSIERFLICVGYLHINELIKSNGEIVRYAQRPNVFHRAPATTVIGIYIHIIDGVALERNVVTTLATIIPLKLDHIEKKKLFEKSTGVNSIFP